MKQWLKVEKLVGGVQFIVTKREFIDQCDAAGIKDEEAREWGLETLSVCGLLAN